MRVHVTSADWRAARRVHRLFAAKPHAEHIASEFALAHLAAVLRTNEIRSVLEFGAGIGTVTYLLLSTLPETVSVECTEPNDLCVASLHANLPPEMRGRLTIHENGALPSARPYDLVIIDGGVNHQLLRIGPGAICFAEGNRRGARQELEAFLNKQGLTCAFANYGPVERSIKWRPSRLGFLRPAIHKRVRKGCWIGRVERA